MCRTAALRAICVSAAVMALCNYATSAQDAEEIDDDDDLEIVDAAKPPWQTLLSPVPLAASRLDFLTGAMPDRLIYFAGFDTWRYSLGGYTGFQWAPQGIHKDGFILRAALFDNIERYTTRSRRYVTEIARGSLLPGIQFTRGRLNIQLLAGLDAEADFLAVNGYWFRPRARLGAKFTTDVWWEPTQSVMLQYSLSGTMIDNAISTRAAAGWRLFDRFWIGPELSQSSDYFSRQTRVGAHLTGLRTGDFEWSFAAGHIDDSYNRDGVYARIGVLLRPPRPLFGEN
jgi:hypothetical protein